jgi:hypothetical protein
MGKQCVQHTIIPPANSKMRKTPGSDQEFLVCGGITQVVRRQPSSIRRRKRGQGITEYGAIIAFISLLVALCFSLSKGSLLPAVSNAFSVMEGNMNNLSTAAGSAS